MKTFIFIFLLIFSFSSYSQNTYLNIYSDTTGILSEDITLLESGNIIIPIHSDGAFSSYPILYKFNPNGEIITTKGITNNPGDWSMIQKTIICDDGNLMAFGETYSGDSTIYNLWILKMDTSFNILNEHIYYTGLNFILNFKSIIDSFGNIILFCHTDYPHPLNQIFIFKLNQEGDSLYAKIYNNYNGQWALDLLQKKDNTGYYLFSQWTQLTGQSNNDIVEVDNNFEIVEVTGQTNSINNNTAMWYNDTSFIVSGQKLSYSSDTLYKIGVTIVDTTGTIINEYYWGEPDTMTNPAGIRTMDIMDGNIYYAGIYNLIWPGLPNHKTWIIINKLDSDLHPIWQKFIGGNNFYYLASIKVCDNGSSLLTGRYVDIEEPIVHNRFFLAKVGTNGEFLSNEEMPQDIMEVKLYPNPSTDYFMIDVKLPSINGKLQLYDIQGKLCSSYNLTNGSNRINTKMLNSGIYVINIIEKNEIVLTTKWLKN